MGREVVDVAEQWPVVERRQEYDGGWVVRLRTDRIRRPGHPEEEPFARVVLEHPGASVVLAVDDHDRVFCLWQYRHAVGRTLVQLPAGLCDTDHEDPVTVAQRELVEEGGLEAADWTHLATTYPSPGVSAEMAHYYLARGLTQVGRGDFEPEHEEAEMVTEWVPARELLAAVLDGRVRDAHVAVALLVARTRGLVGA